MIGAAIALGMTGGFTSSLVQQVERRMKDSVHLVDTPAQAALSSSERMTLAVAEARKADKRDSGGAAPKSTGPGGVGSEIVEQTEAAWNEALRDQLLKDLMTKLLPLHTIPLDAPAVALTLMSAESPAGLIFLTTNKTPDSVAMLKDFGQAKTTTAVSAGFNKAMCVDDLGVSHPTWGQPIDMAVPERMIRGKWWTFTTLSESCVVFGSGTLDLWGDIAERIISRSEGPHVAAQLGSKLVSRDPIYILLHGDVMEFARLPILRAFDTIGVGGRQAHRLASLIENSRKRQIRIDALPPSKGKECATQANRYAVALALKEGQDGYLQTLAASVSVARRQKEFFAQLGGSHSIFGTVDKLLKEEQTATLKDRFDPTPTPATAAGSGTMPEPWTDPWDGWGDYIDTPPATKEGAACKAAMTMGVYPCPASMGVGFAFGREAKSACVVYSGGVTYADCPGRVLGAKRAATAAEKGWSTAKSAVSWCLTPTVCAAESLRIGKDVHLVFPLSLIHI